MRKAKSVVWRWAQAREKHAEWTPPLHLTLDGFDETYELGALLGQGGFGVVHKATDRATRAQVAIKSVHVHAHGPGAKAPSTAMVLHEIQTMRRLSHPNIVSLVEAYAPPIPEGESETVWHLVMELCRGRDLEALVGDRGALDPESLRAVAAQLARAIQHMHEHGVVHRDIKPGNVMVLGGELQGARTACKVLDFGLAFQLGAQFERDYRRASRRKGPLGRAVAAARKGLRRARQGRPAGGAGGALQRIGDAIAAKSSAPPPEPEPVVPSGPVPIRPEPSRTPFTSPPSGTRAYAAPEVLREGNWEAAGPGRRVVTVTVTIDAYSAGASLLHLATGVPPGQDPIRYIDDRTNSPVAACGRLWLWCAGRPRRAFRHMRELDEEVREVIHGLMQEDPKTRMTITQLCQHPWIADAPGPGEAGQGNGARV